MTIITDDDISAAIAAALMMKRSRMTTTKKKKMKKVHRLIALTKATDLGFLIFFFFLQTSVPPSSDSYAQMHGRDSTDIAGCTSTYDGQGEYPYLRGLE